MYNLELKNSKFDFFRDAERQRVNLELLSISIRNNVQIKAGILVDGNEIKLVTFA